MDEPWRIVADELDDPDSLYALFREPPREYGPTPIWWWVGEPLEKERLLWQLAEMDAKGIAGACLCYHHVSTDSGTLVPGDPELFSPAWWSLFRDVAAAFAARGMGLWFSGYITENGTAREIPDREPRLAPWRLGCVAETVDARGAARIELPVGAEPLGTVTASRPGDARWSREGIPDRVRYDPAVNRSVYSTEGLAPGTRVSLFYRERDLVNTIEREAADRMVERFFSTFERHAPETLGTSFRGFFSDEVWAGSAAKWSDDLPAEFARRKGYDLLPRLPALFEDFGPETPKIRIDYYDVVVSLMEERSFRPVHEYLESRGLLHSHDQMGRMDMQDQVMSYVDYFRVNRWYSVPGNDDWGRETLQPGPTFSGYGRRNFRDTKISSSLASLYGRPRVWLEAFHSSGWDLGTADMVAWLNELYAYGANLFDMHGLYYATCGGWWEWAPPDGHIRQPWWMHYGAFSAYVTRLSFLFSQGRHRCDVAVLYPAAALHAGFTPPRTFSAAASRAEEAAWGIGGHLFADGIDFDYIDDESVREARAVGGELRVRGNRYRVLVVPAMKAIRWQTLESLAGFWEEGGVVLACGVVPCESDRAGRDDPEVAERVRRIFGAAAADGPWREHANGRGGRGIVVPDGSFGGVAEAVSRSIVRDFTSSLPGIFVTHRAIGPCDAFFVTNARGERASFTAGFRSDGTPELWDPWTGTRTAVDDFSRADGIVSLELDLLPSEARVVVFTPAAGPRPSAKPVTTERGPLATIRLEGPWELEIVPVLDNRWGDFRVPARDALVGPEVRRFSYRMTGSDVPAELAQEHSVTCGFGPYFWSAGPIKEVDCTGELVRSIVSPGEIATAGAPIHWKLRSFSAQWGIENDPFLRHWGTGPHGLKKRVPDEVFDFGVNRPGDSHFVRACLRSPEARTAYLNLDVVGCARAWLNGDPVAARGGSCEVTLRKGPNALVAQFVEPEAGRPLNYSADRAGLRGFAVVGRKNEYRISDEAQWIWLPEASPDDLTGYFRKTFILPSPPDAIRSAFLFITADDTYTAYVNGVETGRDLYSSRGLTPGWKSVEVYDVRRRLRQGPNVIAVKVQARAVHRGLVGELVLTTMHGEVVRVPTDPGWLCSAAAVDGWDAEPRMAGAADAAWTAARALGGFGSAEPWASAGPTWLDEKYEPDAPGLRWREDLATLVYDVIEDDRERTGRYRFTVPPSTRELDLFAFGDLEAFRGDQPLVVERGSCRPDGATEYRVRIASPSAESVELLIRIRHTRGHYGGAAVPEPIRVTCGTGRVRLADWKRMGLETYSGAVRYRASFEVRDEWRGRACTLDLHDLCASADVTVNGRPCGVRVAPPWRFAIGDCLVPGANRIEVTVANTLANHLSAGIPTGWVDPGRTRSGLFGPVTVEVSA